MRYFLIFTLSITAFVIEARMYQWVEPDIETTQLSGKPPAWYRSTAGGPRVFVFENGRLIDDTEIEVSDKTRQRMRQEAFILAEEDRQKAQEKIAKANEMKKKFKSDDVENLEAIDEDINGQDKEELLTDALFLEEKNDIEQDNDNSEKMDELRKIIADWETAQSDNARKSLQ